MSKIVYDLLLKLRECDDFHNRCDYLLEHSEITELLEYINNLQKQNKQYKHTISIIKPLLKESLDGFGEDFNIEKTLKILGGKENE